MPERQRLGQWRYGLLWLALLLPSAAFAQALEVPELTGQVVDLADLMDAEAEQRLTTRLEAIETQTGAQIAVLTMPSLEDELLEEYSLRVVETWGLGSAERDDGLLVLVSRDDRQIRIEVGYGLEGSVPDALAKRIIDERMVPYFRNSDYGGGLESAVDTLGGLIEGDPDALPPAPKNRDEISFLVLIFLLFFSMGNLAGRGPLAGGLHMIILTILVLFPHSLWATPWGLGFFGALVLVIFVVSRVLPNQRRGSATGNYDGDWWLWSTTRGGSGGFSSGGGFSGGGGSFGGGGASGSW